MPTFRDGTVNILGIVNPGVYVDQILPTPFLTGVPTNIEGIVGVGQWGPTNAPQFFSTLDDCAAIFGVPKVRSYDIASFVQTAVQQGTGIGFCGVRVTDGSDVAASATVQTNGGTLTARYSGSRGTKIGIVFQPSAQAGSFAAIISFPGRSPERFDNISGAGNAFWVALADAINNGTAQRGRSNYVVFTAGVSTAAPTTGVATTLSGGTDGASSVNTSTMMGQDTSPRTGMYALRSTGCDGFALADVTDPSTWGAQLAFAIAEGMLAVATTASSDTISNAISVRNGNGIDDPSIWIIEGDWPSVYDATNGLVRLMSPQSVALGLLGNLSPEQSPINKRLNAVIGTQTSQTGALTSDAEEAQAQEGGIDFIGKSHALDQNFFTFMTGRNASSNTAARGIEYTRLTNFLVKALEGSAAKSIVGRLQSIRSDDPTRQKAAAILNSFFAALKDPSAGSDGYGMIDDFAVQCDLNNNPANLQALGFLFAYCAVRYLNVVRYFVIKLAGGGNVAVTVQQNQPTVAQFA